jgi:hypothetical protein
VGQQQPLWDQVSIFCSKDVESFELLPVSNIFFKLSLQPVLEKQLSRGSSSDSTMFLAEPSRSMEKMSVAFLKSHLEEQLVSFLRMVRKLMVQTQL